jgi:hypothetical protein
VIEEYARCDPFQQIRALTHRAETLERYGIDTLPGCAWSVEMERPERGFLHSLAECVARFGVEDADVLAIVRYAHVGGTH